MKASIKVMIPAAMLLLSLFMACGKGDNKTEMMTDIYIPDINGPWLNAADKTDVYTFSNAPSNAGTGTFKGNEITNGVAVADSIAGSFNHSKVSLTVIFNAAGKLPVTYSGTISGTTSPVMTLVSGNTRLTLNKQ